VLNDRVYYAAGLFNGTGRNTADNNDNKDFAGRILLSPWRYSGAEYLRGLKFGGAVMSGKQGTTASTYHGQRHRGAGVVEYKYDRIKLLWEMLYQDADRTGDLSSVESKGWYLQGVYRISPRLQGVLKFEQYDPDIDLAGDRRDIWTIGGTYFVNENVKLQAEYRVRVEQDASETANDEFITQAQVIF